MDNIEIYVSWNKTVNKFTPSFLNFSAGEVHLAKPLRFCHLKNITQIHIVANILSSEDLVKTLIVTNAIKNIKLENDCNISLILPYLPYSRSDRVCVSGEEFGLQMLSKIINTQEYTNVITFDTHSSVGLDLINNLINISSKQIVESVLCKTDYDCILSPDKGAKGKSKALGEAWDVPVVEGFKLRDPLTGKLSGFGVQCGEDLTNKRVLIPDDIADGSGTFVGLLEEVKKYSPLSVDLFVTHGIFSKGLDIVAEFDKVLTLNALTDEAKIVEISNKKEEIIQDIIKGDFDYE